MTEQEQKEIFARNLNHYISLLGVQKGKLAEAAGVTAGAVTQWLTADKLPRIGKIQSIADFLGVTVTDLIDPHTEQDDFRDRMFAEHGALFDLLEKASPEQLKLIENILSNMDLGVSDE